MEQGQNAGSSPGLRRSISHPGSPTVTHSQVQATTEIQFTRYVLALLTIQQTLTLAICMVYETLSIKSKYDLWFWIRTGIFLFGCGISVLCIVCKTSVAKQKPCNYVIYVIFTVSFAAGATLMNVLHQEQSAVLFLATIAVKSMMQFVYSTQTRVFQVKQGVVVGILAAVVVVIYAKIYYNSSPVSYVFIIILSFSYGLYLLFSIIHMNSGGRLSGKKLEITLGDYVIASLMIYFDWINVCKICFSTCKRCCKGGQGQVEQPYIEQVNEPREPEPKTANSVVSPNTATGFMRGRGLGGGEGVGSPGHLPQRDQFNSQARGEV